MTFKIVYGRKIFFGNYSLVLVIAVAVILAFVQRLFPLSTIRQIALSENLYEADLKFDLESKCKRFLSANIF